MQKLVPSLWYNQNALEAAEFYAEVFPETSIEEVQRYPEDGLPDWQKEFAGKPLVVEIELKGFKISLTNADGTFAPNPSMSFILNFDSRHMDHPREHLKSVWEKLSAEGLVLMPLDSYDFSSYFGWCADKYGVNWQLRLTDSESDDRPFVTPAMLFTQQARGKAALAREKYINTLKPLAESGEGHRADYPDSPGVILYSDAQLAGEWVVINDSTFDHAFTFSEGFSFQVYCDNQEQLDDVWAALAHEEQPCGWCKDEFGVSWQVLPTHLGELMQSENAYEKLMSMTKIQIDQF